MIIGLKDLLKLLSISIVCACAVMVCTFFLGFYIDVLPLKDSVSGESATLLKAQIATAQITSTLAGGILGIISVIMLMFYVKLFIDGHRSQIGVLKAMGYTANEISLKFWVFGLSVFLGCAVGFFVGYLVSPLVYRQLTITGIETVKVHFHLSLLFGLVFAPTIVFTAISCIYARFKCSGGVMNMLKNANEKTEKIKKAGKERSFLAEVCLTTLSSKKSIVFFVAFSCFCFSAMVQMPLSMKELTSSVMSAFILVIGLILAVTSMFMSITLLINSNKKNLAVMKAFGYSLFERTAAVMGGFIPFEIFGFALGTVYQFGLLKIMTAVVFKEIAGMPDYYFNVKAFFITLATFIVLYSAAFFAYSLKINKISVKEIMTEN